MPAGGVATWGAARFGQLGHGRKQHTEVGAPTSVGTLAGRPLSAIACGSFHSACIVAASPSEVHTWGRGVLGLLGHGDEEDSLQPRPVRALAGISVRAIACGLYQTAAVTDRGELFCWGWKLERFDGPAGPSSVVCEGYTTRPERIRGELEGAEVRQVSCGHYCTAAATSDGRLYTWGQGERGQLGQGHARDLTEPTRVVTLDGHFVWDAKFGKGWLLVLTARGELCTCGAGDGGVLGRPRGLLQMGGGALSPSKAGASSYADELTLRPIPSLRGSRVCAISCGERHGACILADSGEVLTWGSPLYRKLGYDALDDVTAPSPVPSLQGKRFVEVACAAHSTLALTDGGQPYAWGALAGRAAPPEAVRLGGVAACTIGAGGNHFGAAIGEYPVISAGDLALARKVGFEPARTRAAVSAAVASELGPISTLLEKGVDANAEPEAVLRELHELRGLLALEEQKRDTTNRDLMELQQQLQQVLVDEELLRERRGGAEPPPAPAVNKGVAVVDKKTYEAMLPDEQVEINLFGFKLAVATSKKRQEPAPVQ